MSPGLPRRTKRSWAPRAVSDRGTREQRGDEDGFDRRGRACSPGLGSAPGSVTMRRREGHEQTSAGRRPGRPTRGTSGGQHPRVRGDDEGGTGWGSARGAQRPPSPSRQDNRGPTGWHHALAVAGGGDTRRARAQPENREGAARAVASRFVAPTRHGHDEHPGSGPALAAATTSPMTSPATRNEEPTAARDAGAGGGRGSARGAQRPPSPGGTARSGSEDRGPARTEDQRGPPTRHPPPARRAAHLPRSDGR